MKENILDIFRDFHSNGIINKVVNATYIALIAKKEKCSCAFDCRPIRLTTTLYKLLAKVIADRLKNTLLEMVSENQMAFIRGRQITDAILIANEAINFWKIKKVRGFAIKLDVEKAFDKINCNFIDYMLTQKDFPFQWRKWIKSCISNVQYSVIINGRPMGKIQPTRGFNNKTRGVRFNDEQNLTHLLFACNILLFVEDHDDSIENLRFSIHLFELASGLNINLKKSTISFVNVNLSRLNSVFARWGISIQFMPINYLGVPLGGKLISNKLQGKIYDKIHKKVNNWKYSYLSKGGKVTLINSTLASLPTYQLSVFKAPIAVCKKHCKTVENFHVENFW